VSGEAAVGGADGPAISGEDGAAGFAGDDGFDGDDEAFSEQAGGGWIGPVGDAGALVDGAADAVSAELADDVKAVSFDGGFDGATDVLYAVAGARDLGCLVKCAAGGGEKAIAEGGGYRLFWSFTDDDGFGRVGHESVELDGDVELEQIAIAEFAGAGDAVDDFVVDADATDAGELVDEGRSGACAVFYHDVAADVVEVGGGDARAGGGLHGLEHEANDAAGGAHGSEFFGSGDGHEFAFSLAIVAAARSDAQGTEVFDGKKLFAEQQALGGECTACSRIAFDDKSGHAWVAFGGFKFRGHAGEKALDDEMFFDADDGIVRAAHADIGLIRGAVVEDAVVGGGDVCVRADDRRDATVEIPAESSFLRCCFRVNVDDDDLRGNFGEESVSDAEGIFVAGHEHAALKIDDGVGLAGCESALIEAVAGAAGRVVGGADDAARALVAVSRDGLEVINDFFFVPDMIAGGEDVGTHVKELVGNGGSEAESARGVFGIDDDEVNGMAGDDVAEVLANDAAARAAEYVTDEEDAQMDAPKKSRL
jgi:hypothetical protein